MDQSSRDLVSEETVHVVLTTHGRIAKRAYNKEMRRMGVSYHRVARDFNKTYLVALI